jgi:hypothetical protein
MNDVNLLLLRITRIPHIGSEWTAIELLPSCTTNFTAHTHTHIQHASVWTCFIIEVSQIRITARRVTAFVKSFRPTIGCCFENGHTSFHPRCYKFSSHDSLFCVKFVVFTVVKIWIMVFWVMTACSLVHGKQCSGRRCCFCLQGDSYHSWPNDHFLSAWFIFMDLTFCNHVR